MDTDILIVGAGPGGLQLAQTLAGLGHSFVIVEKGEGAGSFFRQYPRHRKLISVNKLHTGYEGERKMRFDWNSLLSGAGEDLFSEHSQDFFPSADTMVDYLQEFADKHVPDVRYNTEVTRICKLNGCFHVDTSGGEIRAKAVVIATGVSQEYQPQIPGLELAESYSNFRLDAEKFENKKVLIIGKGNSAFETADAILHKAMLIHLVSPNSLNLAWNTHFPGHLRAVNNNFLDTYQLKIQNAVLDAQVLSLRKAPGGKISVLLAYAHAEGETEELEYDRVICCTGFQMDHKIFSEDCLPRTVHNGRFPSLTPEFESSNVSGLYYAGTLTQSLDYKRSNSAFVHGFRYNSRALGYLLSNRLYGAKLPSKTQSLRVADFAKKILERINTSSAQWQQFGFLGDLATINNGKVTYYEDLPVGYAHYSQADSSTLYLIVTLEFGETQKDVFAIARKPRVEAAAQSAFLHPVIRIYSKQGQLLKRLDLLENLFGEWTDPKLHTQPLVDFLKANLPAALGRSTANSASGKELRADLGSDG